MSNRQLFVLFTSLFAVLGAALFPIVPLFEASGGFLSALDFFASYESNASLMVALSLILSLPCVVVALVRASFYLFFPNKPWTKIIVTDLAQLAFGLAASIFVLSQGGNVAFLYVFPLLAAIPLADAVFDQKFAQRDYGDPDEKRGKK